MVRVFEPPVYCYHEIVHNRHVVERFRARGVVFVDDVADVPHGAPLMLSAHGSAPEVVEAARTGGGVVVDAVCPLVTKVHHELKVRSRKGYTVLYVGHAGHEEAVGTMAVAPQSVRLLEREEDLDALGDLAAAGTPVALLAQTTLSHDEWRGLMEAARRRFPDLWMPNRSDLCFATTNRQAALKAIASEADVVVVIGSANSSNTVALEKVARAGGCPRVLRVNEAFKGKLPPLVGLVHRGGSLADRGEMDGLMPQFKVGEEQLLFVSRRPDGTLFASYGPASALKLPTAQSGPTSGEFSAGESLLQELRAIHFVRQLVKREEA